MFRFFEGLVDPYQPYVHSDTPPRRLWPFLAEYIRPVRKVFAATAVLSITSPSVGASNCAVAMALPNTSLVQEIRASGFTEIWLEIRRTSRASRGRIMRRCFPSCTGSRYR